MLAGGTEPLINKTEHVTAMIWLHRLRAWIAISSLLYSVVVSLYVAKRPDWATGKTTS